MGIVYNMLTSEKNAEFSESLRTRLLERWRRSFDSFFYNAWIADCSVQGLSPDGVLSIGLPLRSKCERLGREDVYGALLDAAREVCDGVRSIGFSVDPSLDASPLPAGSPEIPSVRIAPVVPDRIASRGERPPFFDRYTFANVAEGDANRLALDACRQVAETPGARGLNPLILHGASGLGKTHLLHAVGAQLWDTRAAERVMLRTAEQFAADIVSGWRSGLDDESNLARHLKFGAVLIDDVQFLSSKRWVVERFAQFTRMLIERGIQLVVTSDKPLSELPWADARAFRHMQNGMALEMEIPDRRLRLEILRRKMLAAEPDRRVSEEILEFISENDFTNVRELESVLVKLSYYREFCGAECTLDVVQSILSDSVRDSRRTLTLEMVAAETADAFGVTVEHLKSACRRKDYVTPRKVAMYLARALLDQTLHTIGFFFNRDYSTVSASIDSVEAAMTLDADFAERIERLRNRLVALRGMGE